MKDFLTLKVSIITGPEQWTAMKNFRNNSRFFLLVVSFLIGVSFIDHSRSRYSDFDFAALPDTTTDTTKQPKMVVEEITVQPMVVLVIRDTAATMADVGPVLGKNYSEIQTFMQTNGIRFAGQPMAWYLSQPPPFILEAGIPVNKKPTAGEGRISIREIKQSKAVAVHFWGPYEQIPQAYGKITDWLKKNNKKAIGSVLEIYVTDPSTVSDPYQVQTDIIQIYQ
jgi:effector-binding domain-containing protein